MESSNKVTLTPLQKRTITWGGTSLAAVVLIAIAFYTFLLLRNFVVAFQDVLLPLAISAILATLLRPTINYLETRTRLNRIQGIVLLVALICLILATVAVFVVPFMLEQITAFIKNLPEITNNIVTAGQKVAPGAWQWASDQLGQPLDEYLKQLAADNTETLKVALQRSLATIGSIGGIFGGFLGGFFGKVAAYSIIPVYLFFLLSDDRDVWKDVEKQISFLPKDRRDDLVFLVREFTEILVSFFRGQIIIALLLGLVLAIGFGLIGLKLGIVLGFFLGLLNIIPYLGTMIGLLTVLPLAYFQNEGGPVLVGLCLVVFMIGQMLTDYVFTPRVMGEKTGMGPMLIIFSIFFWGTALGGILGMIMAIPLTAFFLVFWRLAREKYIPAFIEQKHEANEAV